MIIPEINIKDYTYNLPNDRIAEYPLEDRSSSKLMITDRANGDVKSSVFKNLPQILSDKHHLVFNETKVINARIFATKESGGAAEILLLNPISPSADPQVVLNQKNDVVWKCMIGRRKIVAGSVLTSLDGSLKIEVLEKEKNIGECRFKWDDNSTFIDVIQTVGKIPLPPYLERESEPEDEKTYQTVYANNSGSVAAPTAGLHFTKDILKELEDKGVSKSKITLHVGAGTFLPVKSDNIAEHAMHEEMIHVTKDVISEILEKIKSGKKIVAVGTTSIRTLESIAVFGELLAANPNLEKFDVPQWSPYNIGILPSEISFQNVLNWLEKNNLNEIFGGTELIIVPGYKYRVVNHIITNFHQPESTLILLVAAFLGKDLWRESYEFALNNEYRFLSYGDSSILF